MRYLLFLLFLLTSCECYVREDTLCVNYKPIFKCINDLGNNVAICDTKEECNKVCAEKNK